jgi:DNA-binding winged helix-turn-helix (wHTH) protein
MAMPVRKVFRFGNFEADSASGELRKSGVRLRLQDQPFQVLMIFLERSGEVIGREELRQKLWPGDTFVDFDHSLNTIVNKLREALGDSATNPRFIETLAKRGYRFLVPVEIATTTNGESANAKSAEIAPTQPSSSQPKSLLTHPEELPSVPHGYVRVFFLLIQAMYLSFYIVALARISPVEDLLQQTFGRANWIVVVLIVTAAVGIPIRLYFLSAVSFDIKDLSRKFRKLFPAMFVIDELWSLSPFLLAPQIGWGLALAVTAALIYVPFAQRTLVLMRERAK